PARLRFVDYNNAAFHHPTNLIDHYVDVRKRVSLNRNDVCIITRHHLAQTTLHSEQRRAVRRRGRESLLRRHPRLYKPAQLAGVLPEHGEYRVGTHREPNPGLDRAPRRLEVALNVIVQPSGNVRPISELI